MRSGWDPTRRNRNIGTAKRGRGQDNALVIPRAWPDDRVFWEVLRSPVEAVRQIGANALRFLVEPTRGDCCHACTVQDVTRVLSHLPEPDLDGIDLVILRQPTRKQARLNPVWGRLVYYATTGRWSGTAIYLEAQDPARSARWPLSLTPDEQAELQRLRQDGHRVTRETRHYLVRSCPAAVRATQLYRTLLHEVGHYVDWLDSVVRPCLEQDPVDETEDERRQRAYDTRPARDKEARAHRYATMQAERLRQAGSIPFAPQLDPRAIEADGLDPRWFCSR